MQEWEAYKAHKMATDPYWIDRENMTGEELTAALDKMYPRMAEPDEEGIDLHPADPRRRFIATCEGVTFRKADPLTEEDLAELAKIKKMLNIEDDK
ncbi:hypothetical protein [Methanosarcina sp.]|uniref:hypothetical protein n=1 Tax=Methanosarcina sp. TaxID=2213 RepID=UPI003C77057C